MAEYRPVNWVQSCEDEFEEVEFPPRLPHNLKEGTKTSQRPGPPLTRDVFVSLLDSDGRLVDEHQLRNRVFTGGIDPEVRPDAWHFLFELYPFHSTKREREVLYAEYHAKYTALKKRWVDYIQKMFPDGRGDPREDKLLFPAYLEGIATECDISAATSTEPPSPTEEVQQQWAFIQFQANIYAGRESISSPDNLVSSIRIIDKDVPRTDRNTEFFSGNTNPHLRVLRDILITYAAFNPHVGYAQGMNDILARFLVVFKSEVEAYWCFWHYMEHMKSDFVEDGVLNKLNDVRELVKELDTDLLHYLQHLGIGDMTFCHRWMLLCFKREFSDTDSVRCFEMLHSHHLELTSIIAEKKREEERRRDFLMKDGKTRLVEAPVNTNFTFDVFMCVAILLNNRQDLFLCDDTAAVFALICSLTMKLNLDEIMQRAESLFYQYCSKSVVDCFEMVDIPSPTSLMAEATRMGIPYRKQHQQQQGANSPKN